MRINNNMMAMNTHRQLGVANTAGAKSMEKLSSGYRINRAGDDAAGLAISEKMRGQIRGLTQASRNAQDGISLIQTAEGALNETHAILQRMRELAVQSSTDTNTEDDRAEIQKEINQLTSEINRIGNTTEFNTMKLVNGERAAGGSTKVNVDEVKNLAATDLSFADGVTGDSFKIKDNKIAIDNTNAAWDGIATGDDASTIEIEKLADGKLQVTIKTPDATKAHVSVDEIEADADGNFAYNAHGVSFEIAKDDYAERAVGDKMTLAVTGDEVVAGEKATANDFTVNTAAPGDDVATVENLAVAKKAGFENISSMDVKWDGTDLTVTLKDVAGNELSNDKITWDGTAAFTYDNHGVSFDIDAKDATAVQFSKTFEQEAVEKTIIKEDNSLAFQVGANEKQSMSLEIGDMRAAALGISSKEAGAGFASDMAITDGTDNTVAEYSLNVTSRDDAEKAITTIQNATNMVSAQRSALGAVQNRLEHTIKNLDTSAENLQASESRIRDVDMAKEMMEQTKNNILQQASTAMLAQANQAPQTVLSLLR